MTTTTSRPAEKSTRASYVLRIARLVAITFALLIGFGVASASAVTAHADTVAGDSVFGTEVECGGDALTFTASSDETDGSYAKIWVYDTVAQEWVTDDIWVEADYYATLSIADLTFDPGYYMVFVSYAQFNGYDYDYSGEYINSYEQYYSYTDHETSDFCYLGNDLSKDS